MSKRVQQIAAFVFGVTFVVALLAIALLFPTPSPFQYVVFKTVLSLAAAGITAMVPGFLQVTISNWVRACGAIGVFVIVYFYNPAQLLIAPQKPDQAQDQVGTMIANVLKDYQDDNVYREWRKKYKDELFSVSVK